MATDQPDRLQGQSTNKNRPPGPNAGKPLTKTQANPPTARSSTGKFQSADGSPDQGVQLTRRQRMFVENYLSCWNVTWAARDAGYRHPGVQGQRMLRHPAIKALVAERMKEKAMGADEVLARLAQQARASMADFWRPSGGVDHQAIQNNGHLIKAITNTSQGLRVELYDAQAALVWLGKAFRLFSDGVDITSQGEKIIVTLVSPNRDNDGQS